MMRRILVADDSSTIQKVIKIAFSRHDVEMIEAGSYIEALSTVQRAAADVLIVDASLPGAHSPQDFQRLSDASGKAPLLLLVGTYDNVDESVFRAGGFDHFMKKPFESSDIVGLVERLVGVSRTVPTNPRPAPVTSHVPPPPFTTVDRAPQDGGISGIPREIPESPAIASYRPSDGEDEAEQYNASAYAPNLPPPPVTDQTRKGRRAFFENPPFDPTQAPAAHETSDQRQDQDEGDWADEASFELKTPHPETERLTARPARSGQPLPPIPATAGMGGEGHRLDSLNDTDSDVPEMVPFPKEPNARRSRHFAQNESMSSSPEPNARRSHHFAQTESTSPSSEPNARGLRHFAQTESTSPSSEPDIKALLQALLPLIEERLPVLVREAVEGYCERHFKSLARDVIAAELRRLADEKARHLVDN